MYPQKRQVYRLIATPAHAGKRILPAGALKAKYTAAGIIGAPTKFSNCLYSALEQGKIMFPPNPLVPQEPVPEWVPLTTMLPTFNGIDLTFTLKDERSYSLQFRIKADHIGMFHMWVCENGGKEFEVGKMNWNFLFPVKLPYGRQN